MKNPSEHAPIRVGVALGAGSAAALAELGAIEALRAGGVPIQVVAGTSAGAIVGAALANDRVTDLRETLSSLSRSGVLRLFDLAWPREGFLRGQRALELIAPHLGDRIEELPLPYAAIATDLRSGDEVALTGGPVFDAVRASIAVPGIFTPWRAGGRLLVDGGLVNPIPVSVAHDLGAEFVIAVNVLPLRGDSVRETSIQQHLRLVHKGGEDPSPTDESIEERISLTEVVSQSSRIFASRVATHRLEIDRPGFLLQIAVPDIGMFEIHRAAELAEIGRESAERALPQILSAIERAVPVHRRIRDWPRRARALMAR